MIFKVPSNPYHSMILLSEDLKDNFIRYWEEIILRTQNDLNKIVNDSNFTNKEMETFLRTMSANIHFTKIHQNVIRPARKTWLAPNLINLINIHNIHYATKSHSCLKGLLFCFSSS